MHPTRHGTGALGAMGAVPTDRGEGCNTQPMADKYPRRGHCMGASRQPQSLETEKDPPEGVGRRHAEGRLPAGPEYTACACKLSRSPKNQPQTSQTDRGLHASPRSCMRASQSPMPPRHPASPLQSSPRACEKPAVLALQGRWHRDTACTSPKAGGVQALKPYPAPQG